MKGGPPAEFWREEMGVSICGRVDRPGETRKARREEEQGSPVVGARRKYSDGRE